MKILSILVVTGHGADLISIDTDLPNACYPYDGRQCLNFKAAKGTGEAYVKKHFPDVVITVRRDEEYDFTFRSN